MIDNLRQWFETLAPRERLAVVAGTIAVVFALFYYALWHPLNSALNTARTRVTAETNQARWMLGIRDEARLLQASGTQTALKGQNDSLLSIVDATSRSNGLGEAVRHIQPDNNDKAIVSLQKANFNQLLFWLRSLQSDYGISATEMTISRNGDTPGQVEARLTLVRGAA
ncbi:MAG: type II secretion system protein M [Salinisphaera sp.]|jgi:general secretion pathway protein M|nr:type II secretion system protein M [Salinisphaera sp.]